jgi:drug/metabolite transporter (DMT)-like permease
MMTRKAVPWIVPAAALVAVLLWAGTPAATRIAVERLDPLAVAILRSLLAALLALPLILLTRPRGPAGIRGGVFLAVSALGCILLFPLLFTLGVARSSAAHAALLIASAPLFTGLFAALLGRRLPAGRWWIGGLLCLAGCLLLAAGRFGGRFGLTEGPLESLSGDLLILASCALAGAGYVAGAQAAREIGSWPVTLLGLLWCLPLLASAALAFLPWRDLAAAPASAWIALLYLSALSSLLAYAAWFWALAQGDGARDLARTALLQYTQPLLALGIALLLLDERLSPPLVMGGILIMAGLWISQRRAT